MATVKLTDITDIKIGQQASTSDNTGGIAIGGSTLATSGRSIVIGTNSDNSSSCSAIGAIMIGSCIKACGTGAFINESISIGNEITVASCNSIIIGKGSVYNPSTIVIGKGSVACEYAISIGHHESEVGGISIGTCTYSTGEACSGNGSISIGGRASSCFQSISIGSCTRSGNGSIAIGRGSAALATDSVVLLGSVTDNSTGAISIGGGIANASYAIMIGSTAYGGGISIGACSCSESCTGSSISIGHQSVSGSRGVSIGHASRSYGESIAIGRGSDSSNSSNSIAIGAYTYVCSSTPSIVIGACSQTSASNSIVIGLNIQDTASENDIYIGNSSNNSIYLGGVLFATKNTSTSKWVLA